MENLDLKIRISNFIYELKHLEDKYQLEIDHHGEFVSYLVDRLSKHQTIVAKLFENSILGEL
jgi:hypothetical protein